MNKKIHRLVYTLFVALSFFSHLSAENYWFNAEYLYWKIENAKKVIPLVVEAPSVPDFTPVLDIPNSNVVLGDKKIESKWRSGGRFSFGFFCGNFCPAGVELNYFFLSKSHIKKEIFSDGSNDSPFLSVPFIDSNIGLESSFALARPGIFNGSASFKASNSMQGAEINSIAHVRYLNGWSMNVFGGFRYLNFTEKFEFNTESLYVNPEIHDVYSTKDRFYADNNFYGGQLGVNILFNCKEFFFNLKGKIGIGAMYQSSRIRGQFETNNYTNFTIVQTFESGYFALPSNVGIKRRTRFSVLPEVELNIGYAITENIAVSLGYNFLYITNVLRANEQLDRLINPTESPLYSMTPIPVQIGASHPKRHVRTSDMWVQGLNAGLDFIF